MKRLIAVLSGLLVLPAFAEIAPAYYYEELMAQYADQMPDMEQVQGSVETESVAETDDAPQAQESKPVAPVVPTTASPRNASGRVSASRAMVNSNATSSARSVSSRNVVDANPARAVSTRTVVTRPASRVATQPVSRASATAARGASNATSNRSTSNVRSSVGNAQTTGLTTRESTRTQTNPARASIVQMDTVNTPLYISSRVGVGTNNVTTRVPTIRVGSGTVTTGSVTTSETTTSSSSSMSIDELAQLTDYCKSQYVACMDNFCNVLDDNQGRCSCSANLDNYAETEAALKQATEALQDVALQIQYIGLSADEVETLFTQTEAELQMQTTTDSSQLKKDLDAIKTLIVDVKNGDTTNSTGLSFDLSGLLDFTIDSTGFDLTSFFGGLMGNSNSISNQRGADLFKTASSRCKAAVLNTCAAQGVDTALITNSYDLEIDKACIAYERSLTDANDQMSSTVRNAKSVLQRARLMVAQQKNQYDLRGCVNALDDCMQDDFVCGDDYENCLDPTGKYIVNGEVVVGSLPGEPGAVQEEEQYKIKKGALYSVWEYGEANTSGDKCNAWVPETPTTDTDEEGTSTNGVCKGTLSDYVDSTLWSSTTSMSSKINSTNMSDFLQNKIGYHDDNEGRDYGMCMSVLNRCQNLTYEGSGQNKKYIVDNQVVREYLMRTLVQIKSAQDTVLSDYAEQCITDIATCLAQNNYDIDRQPAGDTQVSNANQIAVRACLPMIQTCMSVNGITPPASATVQNANVWICWIMGGDEDICGKLGGGNTGGS